VLLRPLPYHDPAHLVTVAEARKANDVSSSNAVAPGNFLDWNDHNHVFENMGAFDTFSYNLTSAGAPERIIGAAMSASLFRLLGVQPSIGRDFSPPDDRYKAQRVVILGYPLWQRRFHGDPGILGKDISLNGIRWTIAGIMPAAFRFPDREAELYVPIQQQIEPKEMVWRGSHYLKVIARLKPGIRLEQARADMNRLAAAIKQANTKTWNGEGVIILPLRDEVTRTVRPALLVLLGAVGLVLLIACANVANLVLMRASGRHREIGIRAALGAGRARIVKQLITESLLISLCGGAGGLLLAQWGKDALLALSRTTFRT